jgi:hypothetical protein
MAFDWLLGPRVRIDEMGSAIIRPLVLEPDTVREIYGMVGEKCQGATLYRLGLDNTKPAEERDIDQIETMPDWERRRLLISEIGGSRLTVELMENSQPRVTAVQGIMLTTDERDIDWPSVLPRLQHDIVEKLYAEGRHRIPTPQIVARLPYVGWLLVVAAFAWYGLATEPPLSLWAFGVGMLAAAWVTALLLKERLASSIDPLFRGHVIRTISRADIRRSRADRWANVKLSAITLPLGAVVGVAVTKVFG